MVTGTVNFLAVLVACVAYTVLGALWYSPVLFGNIWMKLIGKTKEQVTADFTPLNYLWALVTSFLAAYGIARILAWAGGATVSGGIKAGIVAGICFGFATMWVNDAFEARPKALTIINALFHLIGMVIAGIIIGAWG